MNTMRTRRALPLVRSKTMSRGIKKFSNKDITCGHLFKLNLFKEIRKSMRIIERRQKIALLPTEAYL
jgi:hypothetical protein